MNIRKSTLKFDFDKSKDTEIVLKIIQIDILINAMQNEYNIKIKHKSFYDRLMKTISL